MIEVTRFDGSRLVVNCDLFETVESVPDTVITLTTGRKLIVREKYPEILERIIAYRARLVRGALGEDIASYPDRTVKVLETSTAYSGIGRSKTRLQGKDEEI